MPNLLDLATGPLSSIVSAVDGILGKFITDPEKKLQASLELAKAQNEFTLRLAELHAQTAVTQASVITAETKSESWLARNWRPIAMMVFLFAIAYNYILAPMFGLTSLPLPPEMWKLLTLGMGGYVYLRTAEKTLPKTAAAIAGAVTSAVAKAKRAE